MAINLSAIRDLLLPGLHDVFGEYPEIPTQWKQIFETKTSDKATERQLEIRLLGLPQLRREGEATAYDNNMGQRYAYNYVHKGVGLGFVITRNALKDNLYRSDFPANASALRRSFLQYKELVAANVLNNATTYDPNIGGDGKALCATDHPIDGGTVGNRPTTDVELSESALSDAAVAIRSFKDAAGLRFLSKPKKLIVPIQLQFVAARLLKSELRPGTANNDINAIRESNLYGEEAVVLDFLTSAKAWFVKTDAPTGLTYMEREPFETDMFVDFDTDSLKTKGYERYSFGYGNFRTVYGNFPT